VKEKNWDTIRYDRIRLQ